MNKQQWITQAREHADALRSLVSEWHPTRLVAGRKRSHEYPITAAAAEFICARVREKLAEEQAEVPDPVERFNEALKAGDWMTVSKLLSDAWFGVPESTACWEIRGFTEAVDLMDDPPEDEVVEGEFADSTRVEK
jgi:hypothetical protein